MNFEGIVSNADTLRTRGTYRVVISDTTRDLLFGINGAIQRAHEGGLTSIMYKLPINFQMIDNTVSNTEVQISVYYNIMKMLKNNNYEVYLKFKKNYTELHISWAVRADDKELREMSQLLMAHTRK